MRDAIRAFVCKELEANFGTHISFNDLDSLDIAELNMAVESNFDVNFYVFLKEPRFSSLDSYVDAVVEAILEKSSERR